MKRTLQTISGLALLATVGPPLVFLLGGLGLSAMKGWMAAGAAAWFLTAPAWMGAGRKAECRVENAE